MGKTPKGDSKSAELKHKKTSSKQPLPGMQKPVPKSKLNTKKK